MADSLFRRRQRIRLLPPTARISPRAAGRSSNSPFGTFNNAVNGLMAALMISLPHTIANAHRQQSHFKIRYSSASFDWTNSGMRFDG